MSSQYFEDLEEEIYQLLEDVRRIIESSLPLLGGEMRGGAIKNVEKKCDEADSIVVNCDMNPNTRYVKEWMSVNERLVKVRLQISEMTVEVQRAPTSLQASLKKKVDAYSDSVKELRTKLKSFSRYLERSQLLNTEGGPSESDDYLSRMEHNTEVLRGTSDTLTRAQAASADSDRVCHGVMDDLQAQREQLERSKDKLRLTDENVSESRRILTKIACGAAKSKILVAVVIICELILLGGVAYWKFSPPS